MKNSIVKNIDCIVGMSEYPDKYFDLAVVDPPYGIGEHGGKKREGGKSKAKGLHSAKYKKKDWDNCIPDKKYFDELFRISKNQIIWGFNYYLDFLPPTPCILVWDKKTNDESDFADCELAWASFRKAIRRFKYNWVGFGYLNNTAKERKIHPTQKPVALYDWIYSKYLPDGGKVIDTHLGSGSNRIAADKVGNIDFVGYELDKDYFEAQEKRWAEYKMQQRLF
jgi:site-specific DNA-methyltransferase (adenine-specific)